VRDNPEKHRHIVQQVLDYVTTSCIAADDDNSDDVTQNHPATCSTRAGCCSKDLPNVSDICLEADQNLFRKVLHNPEYALHQLLPSFCLYPQLFP